MAADRSPYGLLVSALGAIVLAVSVFLPWYGVGLTASGVAYVQQVDTQVASRFGNASLQGELGGLHARLSALAGRELGTVSAHQVFSKISVLLLIAAGLGILIALVPLARSQPPDFDGAGPWLAVFGLIAAICVLYRMVARPVGEGELFALSLREGAWLALLGSLAMIAGGLWPRRLRERGLSGVEIEDVWSGLSGWTPEV
jgi:hypothetical protein